MAKKQGNHYIDNKRFLEELIVYKKEVRKAKKEGTKKPGVSNYIGQCFLDIANNLAKKPNFANYIFKEEMISDGIENCIMYTANFDEKKSQNPFAFFTQIIYYAFLRRIGKEKKQLYIKMKCIEKNDESGRFRNQICEESKYTDEDMRSKNPYAHFVSLSDNDLKSFAKSFEEKAAEKKKVAKKKRASKKKASRKTLEDILE
jgi:hypothetical protein